MFWIDYLLYQHHCSKITPKNLELIFVIEPDKHSADGTITGFSLQQSNTVCVYQKAGKVTVINWDELENVGPGRDITA